MTSAYCSTSTSPAPSVSHGYVKGRGCGFAEAPREAKTEEAAASMARVRTRRARARRASSQLIRVLKVTFKAAPKKKPKGGQIRHVQAPRARGGPRFQAIPLV